MPLKKGRCCLARSQPFLRFLLVDDATLESCLQNPVQVRDAKTPEFGFISTLLSELARFVPESRVFLVRQLFVHSMECDEQLAQEARSGERGWLVFRAPALYSFLVSVGHIIAQHQAVAQFLVQAQVIGL